jgi:hypothetical protein
MSSEENNTNTNVASEGTNNKVLWGLTISALIIGIIAWNSGPSTDDLTAAVKKEADVITQQQATFENEQITAYNEFTDSVDGKLAKFDKRLKIETAERKKLAKKFGINEANVARLKAVNCDSFWYRDTKLCS